MRVTLIGAGSREFAGKMVRDLLLSQPIAEKGLKGIVLMDIAAEPLAEMEAYSRHLVGRLGHTASVSSTTDLDAAVAGTDFVITAIERDRYHYWSQDFTVPRKYGFKQVYGENGGPGGLFHALRQFGPLLEESHGRSSGSRPMRSSSTSPTPSTRSARQSRDSRRSRSSASATATLGVAEISALLNIPADRLELPAAGINHFTWFQAIRDKETGEDLYPVCGNSNTRRTGSRTGTRSGCPASCSAASACGRRRAPTISASTSHGPTTTCRRSCSTSTTPPTGRRGATAPRRRSGTTRSASPTPVGRSATRTLRPRSRHRWRRTAPLNRRRSSRSRSSSGSRAAWSVTFPR